MWNENHTPTEAEYNTPSMCAWREAGKGDAIVMEHGSPIEHPFRSM